MRILRGLEGLRSLPSGAVLSIGNFDGIHKGHQRILERARELRDATGGTLAVATFEPHPLTVLRPGSAPPRLSTVGQKESEIARWGVEDLVVLPPEPAVLGLEAEQFWKIVRDDVKPSWLVEGRSFTFGKGRAGNIQRLREWTASGTVQLEIVEPVSITLVDLTIVPVSSTLARFLIGNGRLRDAAICLGRAYAIEGEVIKGHQRGRTIGMPTANLKTDQLIPLDGVYAGRSIIDGTAYPAAVSVGTMPTFGENRRQLEVHLVGFDGNLYGSVLSVDLFDWVREQRKYHGIDALKEQMKRDLELVNRRAEMDRYPSRESPSMLGRE